MLPEVHIAKNLRQFVDEKLSIESDGAENIRIIAHPPIKHYNENRVENAPTPRPIRDRGGENQASAYHNNDKPLEKVGYVSSLDSLRVSDYLNNVPPFNGTTSTVQSDSGVNNTNSQSNSGRSDKRSITIAIGPEGGWLDEEVRLFQHQGFQLVNLGRRILRTDIAVR